VKKPLVALILSLMLRVASLRAAPQQGPPRTEDRISGTVRSVDKSRKTITIQSRGIRTPRQVLCNESTKLSSRDNQPSTLDAIKKGQTLVCLGSLNENRQFAARTCTIQ
jgi:hypothetical protein